MLQAAIAIGLLGIIVYVALRLVAPPTESRAPTLTGHWTVAHRDADGETRVSVMKVSDGGADVLDEHVVATIPTADPDYDAKFMTAMAAARERQALFEAQED